MSAPLPTDPALAMPQAMTFKQRVALGAYTFALRLLLPAILLRYWLRGRAEPGYRFAMRERLGYGDDIEPGSIWIHAVSLGETRAASALIDALRLRRPEMRLLLTHGTATGRDAGQVLMRTGDRLGVVTRGGNIIYPDRQLMLFARDILTRVKGGQVIYDVKCSDRKSTRLNSSHRP